MPGSYDQGETATHEVGHWLNLEHTFYGRCTPKGDFVADTPAEKTPDLGLPGGEGHLRAPGLDPIHNYMDYSYDSCYTEFTAGQAQRMRDAWLFFPGLGSQILYERARPAGSARSRLTPATLCWFDSCRAG